MKRHYFIAIALQVMGLQACAQQGGTVEGNRPGAGDREVGGRCEGCEAIYECPVPFSRLNATDTLPDFAQKGPRLQLSGTIYQSDGKTPAPGIIMYVYHTDQSGRYPTRGNEKGWDRRHGYLRGWIQTDEKGMYHLYTLRPGAYPEGGAPMHIHAIIKEPGRSAYYIEDFFFEGDPNLANEVPADRKPRGGNGILQTRQENGTLIARRDIILGRNIPGY